jgi:lysozyme
VRRRRVAICAAVLVLAGGGVAARYAWLPAYRPSLRPGETYGIDVSHHQGAIDWRRVARDRIAFAYVKATEGGTFTDPRFAANVAGARAAGLRVGAYHFFTACGPRADVQAANFLSAMPVLDDRLPPAVDLELSGSCGAAASPRGVQRTLTSFLERVEAITGVPTVVYESDEFERAYHVRAALDRPRWRRHLIRRPHGDWLVWQVNGFAHVDGVKGDVDLDVMRG